MIDGQPFAFAIRDLVVPYRIGFGGREGWTRFVLPLRDRSSDVAGRLRDALREGGTRSMLFLDCLRHLCWTDGAARERYAVEDRGEGIRALRLENDFGTAGVERYLVLSRPVTGEGVEGEHSVKVAFKQNAEGEARPDGRRPRLAVFFETEEATGLFFHVHGPFRLTDNRANIKRGDTWNEHLADEIEQPSRWGSNRHSRWSPGQASYALTRSFLGVLPNVGELAGPALVRLLPSLVAAMTEKRHWFTCSSSGDICPRPSWFAARRTSAT